ncbi:Crp/Fnr family transcriptional regulator [Chryseobacterium sp.]|uniref:Crp/Fnr family transcriptional regulator n=1 Tax=Chryseobacterium sp. TaxID=1871047 RepID=UPI0025C3F13E|nr:Crp/Fnr family transcriptional regulator [Chryseobacterium sp.]
MAKKNNSCNHSCFMCKHVLKEWWEVIELRRKNISVRKGQQFIYENSEVTGVYFVQEGLVKIHKKWGDKETIIRFAAKDDMIGFRGINTEDTLYPISATALEKTSLCFIEIDFFKSLLKVNPSFTYELMMFLADELYLSEIKRGNMVHLPAKSRIAWCLLRLIKLFGVDEEGKINITINKTDLASYAGTTYETCYRILSELTADQLILQKDKTIIIKNYDQLSEISKNLNSN